MQLQSSGTRPADTATGTATGRGQIGSDTTTRFSWTGGATSFTGARTYRLRGALQVMLVLDAYDAGDGTDCLAWAKKRPRGLSVS